MAGFFQQFLQGAVEGFLGSPNLKDYKHASKTFITNGYQNTPKYKWLFHVYFETNVEYGQIYPNCPAMPNFGLLVKTVELPKYSIQVDELNQYNRKRYIQKKINYNPIRITFHDDNGNQVRKLWYDYYSYYYGDPTQPTGVSPKDSGGASAALNPRNLYNGDISGQTTWGYQGDISQSNASTSGNQDTAHKVPFLRSVKIYGFNQHNFAMYQLINPIIDTFNHDTYSYAETTGTMENSMTLKYETVKYYQGAINGRDPNAIVEKFAESETYDTELSPIARPGSNRSIMGQGGLVDSTVGVLNDINSGNILGALQTAGRLSRTFKNSQQILQTAKAELVAGAINAVSNPSTARSNFNFPAIGANTGSGAQQSNANNYPNTNAKPVNTPGNTPIQGGP